VAFYGGMEFISPCSEYNRAHIGRDIGRGIDDCGNCPYYDGCRCAGRYSIYHSWFTIDYTKYFVRILEETGNKMRLTKEQRLAALERGNVVLHDTIKLLHKLLKEQQQLINEYVTQKMMSSNERGGQKGNVCPGDALYTFKCKRRFERIEKRIEKMRKLIEEPNRGLKAG